MSVQPYSLKGVVLLHSFLWTCNSIAFRISSIANGWYFYCCFCSSNTCNTIAFAILIPNTSVVTGYWTILIIYWRNLTFVVRQIIYKYLILARNREFYLLMCWETFLFLVWNNGLHVHETAVYIRPYSRRNW